MATKKRAATKKSSKKSTKRSATKKASSKSGVLGKRLTKGEAAVIISSWGQPTRGNSPVKYKIKLLEAISDKPEAKGSKKKASTPRGASSTAPVVYQTLRERAAAVEKNIGKTQSLKDFLDSAGWR